MWQKYIISNCEIHFLKIVYACLHFVKSNSPVGTVLPKATGGLSLDGWEEANLSAASAAFSRPWTNFFECQAKDGVTRRIVFWSEWANNICKPPKTRCSLQDRSLSQFLASPRIAHPYPCNDADTHPVLVTALATNATVGTQWWSRRWCICSIESNGMFPIKWFLRIASRIIKVRH